MPGRVFVDTNVLVYARDASEPEKQRQASAWMAHLWVNKNGRLSFQVLQEYYVTVTQKLDPGLSKQSAREDIRSLQSWEPIAVNERIIEGAWVIQDRYQLSWWDSLIVSAAQTGNCQYILTEDLQEDQRMGDVLVVNPFNSLPDST